MGFPLRSRTRGRPARNAGAAGGALPPPAFRAAADSGASTTGTCTVAKPTGTITGDFLVAWGRVNTNTITAPAGWTALYGPTALGTQFTYLWTKVASSEPASWDWTGIGATASRIAVAAFSGCSGVDQSAESTFGSPATTRDLTSITTTVSALVCAFATFGVNANDASATDQAISPVTFTQNHDSVGTAPNCFVASGEKTTPGLVSPRLTLSASATANAWAVALKA